jgi:putative phage-type endonuclease
MDFETIGDSRDRERWLELRRSGIGSSDAPAVLGVSPWGSPLSVYADKIGASVDREASEAMRWGNLLEPLIAEEFAKETGRRVALAGSLLRSAARSWQLSTLDAEQVAIGHDGPGVLEIKATGFRAGDWHEGIPEHVMAQCQHQLATTGWKWGSVAVLLFGCRLLWADFERDDALIERMNAAEAEFWRRVEERQPPAPDGSEASREALRLLYPRDTGETVRLPGDLIAVDAEREALKAELKSSEHRLGELDAEIKAALGDATTGVLANGVSFTFRAQERKAHTVKASTFRVLRRSEAK